jgi:hypothetical protein
MDARTGAAPTPVGLVLLFIASVVFFPRKEVRLWWSAASHAGPR